MNGAISRAAGRGVSEKFLCIQHYNEALLTRQTKVGVARSSHLLRFTSNRLGEQSTCVESAHGRGGSFREA